jgi:glycosyltransferase involved in cell wall biosynthesis
MKLRVAHVTATFPPYRGGTGNVCYHNARELARRGHEVHVFTAATPGAPAAEERDDIAIHRLRPLLRVGNAPVLPGLLGRLRGLDIVHLHYPFFGGEISALAAGLRHTPLVITYHQDVLLSGPIKLVEQCLRQTIGRLTLRSALRILFTSRDYAQATYVRPLLAGRAAYIGKLPNGVDLAHFTPGSAPDALRAQYGIAPADRVALLVAGLDRAHYFKGVPHFLTALAGLPPQIKALIVGDGDLRGEFAAQAARLGLSERVVFAGRVATAALPDHYRLADVTVLPSTTMGEAFGLVLVESMACGTPVIASDLPGVRTVVTHGSDGLLVRPGDSAALGQAIEQIVQDEPKRQAMGRAGLAKVAKRYNWEQIGAQLEQIYLDVLRERAAAGEYARGNQ